MDQRLKSFMDRSQLFLSEAQPGHLDLPSAETGLMFDTKYGRQAGEDSLVGEFLQQFPRVTGKGWQDVLTPLGWPQWRTTYHITTSVWKMPLSWHLTDHSGVYWQHAELCSETLQAEQWWWQLIQTDFFYNLCLRHCCCGFEIYASILRCSTKKWLISITLKCCELVFQICWWWSEM